MKLRMVGGHSSLRAVCLLLLICLAALIAASGQEKLDGCDMDGSARGTETKKLNRLKNRYTRPMPEDYTRYAITLDSLLARGDDRKRFSNSAAADITGWVKDVRIGGVESCNCYASDSLHRDTHIVLASGPGDSRAIRTVITEVTPRWRVMMRERGVDWSTAGLKKSLVGKRVRIRGWMIYDWQYKDENENTNPGGKKNWRATGWEIHPVISIEVLDK